MPIRFGPEICSDPVEATKREWLETNGLGGFASSTIIGLNTRRYHGLLMAATKPPAGRVLLLSKLEETLVTANGERFELAANRYPGVIHPQGFQYLAGFRLDPFPVFTYRCGSIEIEKRVFMAQGENTVVVEYDLPAGYSLELRPLIAFRDYHATTHENGAFDRRVELTPGLAAMRPYPDRPTLYLAHNAAAVDTAGADWYRNFEFSQEEARGLDFREDLFNPCVLRFSSVDTAKVIASTSSGAGLRPAAGLLAGPSFNRAARQPVTAESPLATAANQFIVKRGELNSIIAGYHWFCDWGRDTMIALPGLTLTTKRFDIARNILRAFAASLDQGMLPNRFPDSGETPEYNTVDATLWFFEAVRAYLAATGGDHDLEAEIVPKLVDVVDWHVRGTRYNIHVDDDGLLACGEAGLQLTWMDAKVGDWVVTPRQGKPVEIQALWYNALRILEALSPTATRYGQMADQARDSFSRLFWNVDAECLYDVIDGDARDAAIRPNQIFAVSLPHSILGAAGDRARAVVAKVQTELLTPMGLRTLAPGDPNYKGRYQGGVRDRDSSYHQGTVWPWLIGPFLRAFRLVNGDSPAARRQAREWLEPLVEFAQSRGVGQLPEIADGDAPHEPKGCIAQAWSVAEVLRSLAE